MLMSTITAGIRPEIAPTNPVIATMRPVTTTITAVTVVILRFILHISLLSVKVGQGLPDSLSIISSNSDCRWRFRCLLKGYQQYIGR